MSTDSATSSSPLLDLLFEDGGACRCLVAPDGSVLRVNREWLRVTRLALDDVLGADLVALLPGTRDLALAMHARARAGHHVELPRHAQRVGGRETWWEGSVDPVPMAGGVGLLVTAREVEAGGAGRRPACTSPSCGTLFDVVNDAVFVHDAGTGAVLDVNRKAEELYEAPREELCTRGIGAFSLDEPPFTAREALVHLKAAAAGAPQLFEWHARTASGRLFWVEVNLKRVATDRCDRLFAVVRDVTDRKRAEDALRESAERLREEHRRKDQFLGMLSHELRNPLAPIRNSLYVLRHAASADADRALAVIDRQAQHLTRLVDDLLDVTRVARGKIQLARERLELRELVRRVGEDFRSVLDQRGVAFRLLLPHERVHVDADPTRLAQVIGNLLHNAAKFTRQGDEVALCLEVLRETALIRVCDTGAGVDPALLPDLFEPFVQAERTLARTEGGLGLGLALVKGVVDLHGGTVRAHSAGKGSGAEFSVELPRAAAPSEPIPAAPRGARAGARRRVLVVDDNRDAADSLAQLVEVLGHRAEVAYDGPAALAKVRASLPDVVLCDIGLPGMDGYEVARVIRSLSASQVLLVAVSGYANPEDVARTEEAGFDVHVAKPADPDELERLLG